MAGAILVGREQVSARSFRVPGVFGPAVDAPADAAAHARLLALLGRALPTSTRPR